MLPDDTQNSRTTLQYAVLTLPYCDCVVIKEVDRLNDELVNFASCANFSWQIVFYIQNKFALFYWKLKNTCEK